VAQAIHHASNARDDKPLLNALPPKTRIRHSGERRNPVKNNVRSTQYKKVLCASHSIFKLDSGVRRNDESLLKVTPPRTLSS